MYLYVVFQGRDPNRNLRLKGFSDETVIEEQEGMAMTQQSWQP